MEFEVQVLRVHDEKVEECLMLNTNKEINEFLRI
jgi:hypothetical protein